MSGLSEHIAHLIYYLCQEDRQRSLRENIRILGVDKS